MTSIFSSSYFRPYLALAYYDGKPAAGAILVPFDKSIFYYLGATDYELTKTSQASNLLHFEIIRYAKNSGYAIYDLGGGVPMNPDPKQYMYGVYIFKKNFGGTLTVFDGGYLIFSKNRYWLFQKLMKYKNHPLVRSVYNLMKR